jgi:hypothetical protein
MKILITGASGLIGTVIRDVYKDCDVTLLSRSHISARHNEQWYQARNIGDGLWWSELPNHIVYDVVFHLAEPIKQALDDSLLKIVVDGHINFITHIIENTSKLIYPLTAYLYDDNLSNRNRNYSEIKKKVFLALSQTEKISFPVIHPLCDHGNGLNSLINFHRRIPYANLFYRFNANLPVLRVDDLKKYLSAPDSYVAGKCDLYSEQIPVSNIFSCPDKANVPLISNLLFSLMKMFDAVPSICLLTCGRTIRPAIT